MIMRTGHLNTKRVISETQVSALTCMGDAPDLAAAFQTIEDSARARESGMSPDSSTKERLDKAWTVVREAMDRVEARRLRGEVCQCPLHSRSTISDHLV